MTSRTLFLALAVACAAPCQAVAQDSRRPTRRPAKIAMVDVAMVARIRDSVRTVLTNAVADGAFPGRALSRGDHGSTEGCVFVRMDGFSQLARAGGHTRGKVILLWDYPKKG